ncbi:MAG: flagellar biosynthesis protein FlhF [Cellvibrionaceae bacterium]
MQSKRFVAADMRRALTLVRDELGEDAMILSTQRTGKGVEIVATSEELPAPTTVPRMAVKQPQVSQPVKGLASGKTQEELALELEMARRRMMAVKKEENMTIGDWAKKEESPQPRYSEVEQPQLNQWLKEAPAQQSIPQRQSIDTQVAENKQRDNEEIRRLQDEIANMRNLFETQLASMAESQERRFQDQQAITDIVPVIVDVKQRLETLGLTRACNDQVIRSLKSIDEESMNEENLWAESLARLSRSIPAVTADPVATGGIYAFLGTTGVGKTTTIAKFAARYVMEHGPQEVALLTTDTFRIAAHDQLRSLGRILNVQVKVVDDLQQLPAILSTFSRQALVLIDTPGMSYNDPLLKAHLTALRRCQHVQNALVLSANSQYQMMQASLHSYRIANPRFCVMTKLDECASLGDAISLLTANNLPLAYVTNGQSVPDDLAVIKPHQLVSKAVKLSKTGALSSYQSKESV